MAPSGETKYGPRGHVDLTQKRNGLKGSQSQLLSMKTRPEHSVSESTGTEFREGTRMADL